MDVHIEVESGFMDTPIPVVKLNKGWKAESGVSLEAWIPWYEWELVRDALDRAMSEYPEYVERAREVRGRS